MPPQALLPAVDHLTNPKPPFFLVGQRRGSRGGKILMSDIRQLNHRAGAGYSTISRPTPPSQHPRTRFSHDTCFTVQYSSAEHDENDLPLVRIHQSGMMQTKSWRSPVVEGTTAAAETNSQISKDIYCPSVTHIFVRQYDQQRCH